MCSSDLIEAIPRAWFGPDTARFELPELVEFKMDVHVDDEEIDPTVDLLPSPPGPPFPKLAKLAINVVGKASSDGVEWDLLAALRHHPTIVELTLPHIWDDDDGALEKTVCDALGTGGCCPRLEVLHTSAPKEVYESVVKARQEAADRGEDVTPLRDVSGREVNLA